MLKNLVQRLQRNFRYSGEVGNIFSPGRVNLIGEHTDFTMEVLFSLVP